MLVWSLPGPGDNQLSTRVEVKLADYGISRLSLPAGAKGFGGTEGFMAPEIMRFNGEEEYTDKVCRVLIDSLGSLTNECVVLILLQVDCFSFGMFLYELITLRQPFEGHESVKEFLLEGGRPSITPRVLINWHLAILT